MISTNSYGFNLTPEINFYKSILSELSVVIDVGCRCDNIFYDLNPNLEIHLFEPMTTKDILSFGESLKNIPNVFFNNYGLSSKNEVKKFYTEYTSLSTDWHKYHKLDKTSVMLEFHTLYDYIVEKNLEKIDLLKMDTESWDFEVIKGAKEKIWDIPYIQFEYGWATYGDSNTVEDIYDYFSGYNFYDIGGSPKNYVITKKILNYPKIR